MSSKKNAPATRLLSNEYTSTFMVIDNCAFLLWHAFFGLAISSMHVDILFAYNFFSILVYGILFLVIQKGKYELYLDLVILEIATFMCIGVISLGWSYGFQLYSFGFAASIMFSHFNHKRTARMDLRTILKIVAVIIVYLSLKLYTINHLPLYALNNKSFETIMDIINSGVAFLFSCVYLLFYSRAVSELETKLNYMADHDTLTGLTNRRSIDDFQSKHFIDIREKQIPCAAAMMDIDHFKIINDTYGHSTGDDVLVGLAQHLKNLSNNIPGFTCARWGGEEFLMIFEDYENNNIVPSMVLEQLRRDIEDSPIRTDHNMNVWYTVTIGLAVAKPDMRFMDLVNAADENLYKGKKSGRNQVVA